MSQNYKQVTKSTANNNSLACFHGGECVYRELCNCSRFNATGPRCQTVYNTGAERDHICRTWGQYNFETFDGLYYYFSGKSTYALVRHAELDEQSFSIQVNNDPECHSSPYSCKRSISLFFSGDEQIKMSSEVTYKGFGVKLPYVIGNLHIQKLAGYFLVRHQYAFTLAWDGTSAVYIKMAPEYLGKTHGLCGNNNAILQDDMETSYGKLTDDVTEFVESWQENPPQGTPDWDKSLLSEPPCLTQSHESLQRAYALCNILLHPPFKQCHEYVSPLSFMASCTNDLCMSAADDATWCRALTEYARACAQAGKPLHGWRVHFQQCVITCAEPLTYSECINCCPVSCHQQSQCIGSELHCIDGCYCPDGLIYENGSCVKPMECPCDYHGSFFEMGSVVYEECNNCTCIGGKWICTNFTCPAECSVSGDTHFMTFDGRRYTFQAPCQYILAKSRTSGMFTVSLQNAPCGQNQDGSCIQSVSLILKQDPKRQVTLTHSGDLLIYDQYKINLPYADELFEIRKLSSVFLQVKTQIGLQILYDREGLRLYLQVDERWKDDTVGLCGTFNGNTEDDFLSPVGVTESTPELFGNSWKTSSGCVLVHDNSQVDPCDVHLQAAEACSILTKDLFAPCYPYLSPVPYFEQCRRDTCKCGQTCFCSALAHYAHHCRRFGIVIDFRGAVPDCALSCEDTKEYSTCVSTCGRTCQALSVPETCSSDCVEGCACPSGMYLDIGTERCVQRNECPCFFQGIDYPPGENVMTSLGKCHCMDGVMNCDNNIIAHSCPVGQIYINCSNPQVDPELSRERTCENQLLNLTFSAHLPCVSGCVCPPGLVKHGDICLDADECPCSWKGKEYFPANISECFCPRSSHLHSFCFFASQCNSCNHLSGLAADIPIIGGAFFSVCQHGSFQCTFQPCPSMCTAYGDRHYRTFDGLTFDFVGTCKVYLVKGTSSTSLSIVIENVDCFSTGIICRKNIFINVGKSLLVFDDETGNPSLSSYIDGLQKMQLWKAGFFTVVHFPDEHITILWDQRTTVHVQMGHQWQGELTGLCGNFDLKTVNELRTPDNFELTNAQEFGNSWTAVECVDSPDIRNPCSLNPLREPFAKKECGILLSEAFEACHPVIDVTWFYSNCLTDTCGCNQGGDCECFCTSVSAYAHQCCQHGVAVDWRSPRVCPYDCEYFNKALGKGPYKLVSYLDGRSVIAAKLVDGIVFPVKEDDDDPGHVMSFMLTSGLYKPKAHDSSLISFETAERPNYFLQLASNNTLVVSKWKKSEDFHNRSTFVIHKNTWLSGYSSFESFAKPGFFIHISASSVGLLKYHHSEEFRLSTLFKLMSNLSFCPVPRVNGVMTPAQALASRHAGTLWEKTVRLYQKWKDASLPVLSTCCWMKSLKDACILKTPVSSATTGAAAVLTILSEKTTSSPTTMPPVSVGKTMTEPPLGMVQHLTGSPEVLVTTTLVSTTQTSKFEVTSEMQTPSVSSLLMIPDHPNDTAAPSVSSFTSSTKTLHGLTATFSDGLTIAEAMAGAAASPFMLPRETAALQTCTPITESECIKHICLDGQLIQVNKSQNCPYNATQPSCGVLGFATQTNGDKCCPKWECACKFKFCNTFEVRSGRCTIFSDLSIVTYDGSHLALFKEASYIVSQTPDETITIHVLDCRMSDSNSTSLCLAMLNLTYISNQIIINRLSRKITVNSRSAWPTVRKYGYKVEDSGFKYAVETPTKIRIQWFHNTGVMIIELNNTREPRALGLCGFCDRSLENDLMLPNRTVLSQSSSPSTFIDSWQVPDTLKYVGEDRHQETNCSVMDCSECLRMVLNQTFSSCHPYIPPEQFCDIWARDTEYIQNPCVSLAAYVAMCNKFNICIEWRSSDYCPFPCSENFSYQPCIAACEVPESCQNKDVAPLGSDSCSVLTEGCVCAAGTLLHRTHTAVCIPEEKCACTDSSGAPHAVGEIWRTSLSGCCMQKCVDSETIVPVEHSCPEIHSSECQRFAEVALLVPDDQTCCPQKICICNQSLCELLIPECSSLEKLVTYYSEESCCPSYVCECDPEKCEPLEQMPSCQHDQTLIAARVENTCCISYICACGACSDQIPKCQEGEVLIVDGNTTGRCCPTYQCICEIHRCPEFRCVLGMSLVEVWSPEKCCPFRTCECACETIPKPQCKLGQKLQIDELFQNSTENVCNCVKYKCVKDKVCLSDERGVLLPGQRIVEHSADGICHISYCTNVVDPSTKYYKINTSSIDCAVKCKANQVYQPPKDLTTCCGSCKNLSCLHTFSNGTVTSFKPGAVWISSCIRYECTNTAIGPVLVSSPVGCPPFNETECVKVGGYVVPFLEGCCKTCKEDGKFCKKVTVRMTIRKNDCRSNTPVNIVSCDGKCPSASIYNYNINTYARFCKCCRELGLQRRTVQLYCTSNSTWVSYSIQEPTDCSCQWS
ncbi:hypothetical protein EK904_007912 [Melospiza melodia maxima]|nr:hypothetical protein EK904_007912 [Melospiza melodia maxima]